MKKEVVVYDVNKQARNALPDTEVKISAKGILEKIEKIHSFEDSIALVNEMSSLGRMQWTVTAMAIYKACSFTKSQKEAREMLNRHASAMGYSEAQAYNYKKAGDMLLKGLSSGEIKSFNDLPASVHEFIGQYKKPKDALKIQRFKLMDIPEFVFDNESYTVLLITIQDVENEDRKGYALISTGKSPIRIDQCEELVCEPYKLKTKQGKETEAYNTYIRQSDGKAVYVDIAKMPFLN